ncbi:MAG: hypothetical protein FWE22_03180 [Firmicutes bacterium]|nr:hypothetical protein [Bacillota bacterium]
MKEFKVKTKQSTFDRMLRGIARIFKRKPKFVNLNDGEDERGRDLPKKCILIGNHNGVGGAFSFRTFMKNRFMTWGAYQMLGNFVSRRKYLYHVLYRQKLGWNKFRAGFMSVFFGFMSRRFYQVAGIIPTYPDSRVRLTFKYSMQCLEHDIPIFVFPENSDEGYKEQIEEFWPGFLTFSELYYRRHKEDLPIYTCYYQKNPKTIAIGKPMFLQELRKEHSEKECLEIFREYMNSLQQFTDQR